MRKFSSLACSSFFSHRHTNIQFLRRIERPLCFQLSTTNRRWYSTVPPPPPKDETIVELPDKRKYTGTFHAESKYPLPGTTLEEDGDIYIGEYNPSWQRHGRGKAWLADGTHYDGRFENDEFVEGKVTIPDGMDTIVFEGTLKNELFVKGTLTSKGVVYVGGYEENAPHGKGTMKLPNGAYLEGNFFRGKLHGHGKMKLENGYVYIGEFVHGTIMSGELRTPEYNYEGQFGPGGLPQGNGRSE
eukprot:PhF_6_TR6039/c0_g1_i1/m.8726